MIKRKTLILVGTAIVCLLFSLWLSVWQFSQENIRNLLQDLPTVSFTGEQISTIGWDATEFGLLSVEENPAIEVRCDEPIYVQNLLIDGSIDRELTEVTVAYTETPDEPFTAEIGADFDFGELLRIVQMRGELTDYNSLAQPEKLVPVEVAPTSARTVQLPPRSFSVLVFRK